MNVELRREALDGPPGILQEARRAMEICNACRYCEGYCPVFPAMTLRRAFPDGDLGYLAHLCHNCKGCYHACQYAPPHEFGLNLPATLSELRAEDYERFAFPAAAGRLFRRNGFFVALATAAALSAVLILSILFAGDLSGVYRGPGAFYAVIPHGVMSWTAGIAFGWAVLAIAVGVARYWRACGGGRPGWRAVRAALPTPPPRGTWAAAAARAATTSTRATTGPASTCTWRRCGASCSASRRRRSRR